MAGRRPGEDSDLLLEARTLLTTEASVAQRKVPAAVCQAHTKSLFDADV